MGTRRRPILTKSNVPIARLSTFQNEGVVPHVVVIESDHDLALLGSLEPPYFVLGKGSNTVIDPQGKYRTFVQVSPDYQRPVATENSVHVGTGIGVKAFLDFCISQGLSGLEFAAGVPASIGGMTVMNFGCWGDEMAHLITEVQLWHPQRGLLCLDNTQMAFGYRSSALQSMPGSIVLSVKLALQPDSSEAIRERVHRYLKSRSEKQPIREKTFGSTFKNPTGHFAAVLIESVGLKGQSFGGLKISDKHANFLVNTGTATFSDLMDCLRSAQEKVKAAHGVDLELEVKIAS